MTLAAQSISTKRTCNESPDCASISKGRAVTESIATTGTDAGSVFDDHPDLGRYEVKLFNLPVDIGGESVDIPFGIQPAKVDRYVQADGAIGVIGIGLYEKFQVLVDCPNRRLVLGKYE